MVLQLTIDCADPQLLVPFWAAALHYVVEPPPEGFPSWNDYWRHIGVPDDELPTDTDASDSIIDPNGLGPRVWFQVVPEPKSAKKGATRVRVNSTDGLDHYGVVLQDPEGNEFCVA